MKDIEQAKSTIRRNNEISFILLKLLETFRESSSSKSSLIFNILEIALKLIYKIIQQYEEDTVDNEFNAVLQNKLKSIINDFPDNNIQEKLLDAIKNVENRIYIENLVFPTKEINENQDGSSMLRASKENEE